MDLWLIGVTDHRLGRNSWVLSDYLWEWAGNLPIWLMGMSAPKGNAYGAIKSIRIRPTFFTTNRKTYGALKGVRANMSEQPKNSYCRKRVKNNGDALNQATCNVISRIYCLTKLIGHACNRCNLEANIPRAYLINVTSMSTHVTWSSSYGTRLNRHFDISILDNVLDLFPNLLQCKSISSDCP